MVDLAAGRLEILYILMRGQFVHSAYDYAFYNHFPLNCLSIIKLVTEMHHYASQTQGLCINVPHGF